MHLRSLVAVLLWAPGIAAQEVIEFPKAQYPRGRERETIRPAVVALGNRGRVRRG